MQKSFSIVRCCAIFTVLLAWVLPQPAVGAERPNMVFIISGDQDFSHLGFMGNKQVHTPTLDLLLSCAVSDCRRSDVGHGLSARRSVSRSPRED